MMEEKQKEAIILFDGICNFCNSAINLVLRHDRKKYFRFAPLQSKKGEKFLAGHNKPLADSIILLENGKLYQRSAAALRIARKMDGAWKLLYAFIIIPAFLRDPVYDFIAANRYRWFGKKDTCMIPGPEVRERFLGD